MVTAIVTKQPKREKLAMSEVDVIQAEGHHLILKVHGDLQPTLKVLAELQLEDLEVSHLPLEEVFMEYYR
jgi:hypothetical protein